MTYTSYDCEQRTPEWFALRRGRITASEAHKLTTSSKFGTFKYKLLAETLTDPTDEEPFVNDAMQRGIDMEQHVINLYAESKEDEEEDFYTEGFCVSHDYPICGASPDLVVGSKGLSEIKIPNTETHLRYIEQGPTTEIICQMQYQLFVLNRAWNDFTSFDDRLKDEKLHLYVKRFKRDEAMITEFKKKAVKMKEFINMFRMEHGV